MKKNVPVERDTAVLTIQTLSHSEIASNFQLFYILLLHTEGMILQALLRKHGKWIILVSLGYISLGSYDTWRKKVLDCCYSPYLVSILYHLNIF